MERSLLIAVQARRIGLLADRVDLLYPDPPERARRALADGLHPLDVLLVAGAGEAERLCAAGVQMLRGEPAPGAIRDLLGGLSTDNLLAVYFALPSDQQRCCRRDEVWAHALTHAPGGIPQRLDELENLRSSTAAPPDALSGEERLEFLRFSDNLLRRSVGLPYELGGDEEEIAVAGEAAVASALSDGLD